MAKDWGLLFRVVATYIGAIIGAGFASGQEILQFFIMFGPKGILGVVLATLLFSYLGAMILYLAVKFKSECFQEMLSYLLGPVAGKIMDIISMIMLVGGLVVMLTGSGAVVKEYLGLSSYIGTGGALVVIFLVIIKGLQGLLAINGVLVPLKMLGVSLIALLVLNVHQGQIFNLSATGTIKDTVVGHWIWASILYVSYNMVVPLAVLSSLGKTINVRIGIIGGVMGGLGLGITAALVTLAGLACYPAVADYQVPMLFLASQVSTHLYPLFALILWMAMVTTAIADVHGFASRVARNNQKVYRLVGISTCILVLPLTRFDFARLVKVLYPLFGYAGLALLAALLVVPLMHWYKIR